MKSKFFLLVVGLVGISLSSCNYFKDDHSFPVAQEDFYFALAWGVEKDLRRFGARLSDPAQRPLGLFRIKARRRHPDTHGGPSLRFDGFIIANDAGKSKRSG